MLAAVSEGRHHDPHSVLGAHLNPDGSVTVPEVLRPYLGGLDVLEPVA